MQPTAQPAERVLDEPEPVDRDDEESQPVDPDHDEPQPVNRLPAGPKPFDRLVDDHGDVVLRVCRALLSPADAEDAWSETFLAALRAYPRLPVGSNVRGWLVTIAHRKAIDRHRTAARAPILVGSVPERPTDAGVPTEPDTALWDAVRALPPKQRRAVAYHYLADLPYAEVGVLIGSSEAAARRSAADGVANLRKTYRQETSP